MLVWLLAASTSLFAQTGSSPTNPWAITSETALKSNAEKQQKRQIIPQQYQTLRLNVAQMKTLLAEAPLWHTEAAEKKAVYLTFPMPDGSFQEFRIVEAPVMHPDLAKKYPMIKSYAGTGMDDPSAYARFDFTQRGFHAMILGGENGDVFIDPYSTADIEHYISYFKRDFFKDSAWECVFDEVNKGAGKIPLEPFSKAGDCKLRTYTLALACTGEYATFHGGTVPLVAAAMNTSMTRVNGVFELDASVHMTLHPNNDLLIFLNASSDPYTNNNGSTMLGQNQTTCDNVIGNANYDIGHVFSTGGGGVAYLGCVCNSSNKAGGVTGQSSPIGDPFDIDYVAHEMGHQYGANHTQNNNCNRNNATAMEPGSASTIMGYAGICAPNIQPHSDDYFHAISLQEIAAEVTSGTNGGSGSGGNVCSTNTTINNPPTAAAGSDYTIPKSTPFVLTGTGTDPDGGQVLKYCWEQMDFAVATMPPNQNNTGGPTFRSWKQVLSPSRYFPKLDSLVANDPMTWEVLPAVGRTLNFRFTVRDNFAGGGCTAEDNMIVTVNGTAGPFVVTAPNTAVNWPALSQQTVTWDVAGTTAAPVSCANVDILLSTDGGFTYPITLATATPNDGSQTINLPSNTSTTARIMVRGNGNIFFDISDVNFTISLPANNFIFDVTPNSVSICQPTNAIYTVNIGVDGSFSGNVTLSTSGLPAGASASFSPNPVIVPPPGTSTLTVSGLGGVTPGTYSFTVSGTGSTGTQSETVQLIVGSTPAQTTLSTPANGATAVSQTPTLTWNAVSGATTYDVQVALDASFTNLVVNATGVIGTSYNVTTSLAANTLHHWRVRAINSCGNGAYSTTFTFTTGSTTCTTFASTDVPKTISASGTPTVTSILTIAPAGTITDVNLTNLNITHTWISDVVVKLKSPANTERTMVSQICTDNDNMIINFDDESANPYSSIPCPPTNNGTYQPNQTLSPFDGQAVNGTWTLTVQDVANQDGGTLNSWSLNVCYTPSNPPVSVTITSTNISCNGGNNGSATANPSGGNGSYTYLWSNSATTQTINNLTAGTYTVTVTSDGNTATASTTITQPAVLAANVTGVNPSSGNNGTATATPTGGTSPYTYLWSTGGTSQTITGLGAGTYTCTVTDANSCTATGSVTLVQGDPPVSVTITSTNVSCNGGNNGSATANPSGGNGSYTYLWSNSATTQTINNLTAGTYTVTVTSNGNTATASTTITQPAVLAANVTGVNPSSGNNGTATATPTGGTPAYSYLWSTGGTTQTITGLGAGTYTCTVTDSHACTATSSVTLTAPAALKFENGTLSGVGDNWVTVNLSNSYTSMVVVATVIQPGSSSNTPALVTRVQNASGTSFQVRVQKAKYSGTTTAATVHWIAAEEGTYTVAANGVKFEAKKFTSTTTSKASSWLLQSRTYSNSYTTPVVVGQVMSFNDANWSVFWASRANNASNPPSSTSFSCGKHIAEDIVNTTRANETIGYMVFESGTGFINGKKYRAALGSDIVQGTSNNSGGYSYTISGMTTVETAAVSSAAMDGTSEGAWGVMAAAPTNTTLKTWALEDDIKDTERSHTTEQMAWFVIGTGTAFGGGSGDEQLAVGKGNNSPLGVGGEQPGVLFAYPNPAKTQLTVEFEQKEETANLVILDVLGKVVLTEKLDAETGYRHTILDVSNLQPGYYFLQLLDGKERRTVAFVRE